MCHRGVLCVIQIIIPYKPLGDSKSSDCWEKYMEGSQAGSEAGVAYWSICKLPK